MAATLGVTNLHGFTVPAGCVIRQLSFKESIENYKKRSATGTTIRNIPGHLKTTELVAELDGLAPLSLVTAGEFTEGTLKAVSVRGNEGNEDVPTSTVTMKAYESVGLDEE